MAVPSQERMRDFDAAYVRFGSCRGAEDVRFASMYTSNGR